MEQIRFVKITTLAENIVYRSDLLAQWGLSFLIETKDVNDTSHKLIFDSGSHREGLLSNLQALKVDLSDLQFIILSHGHDDHTAATKELLERSCGKVKIIAHPHAFLPRFEITSQGKKTWSGIPKGERLPDLKNAGASIISTKESYLLFPGVVTSGQIPRVTDFEDLAGSNGQKKRFIVSNGEVLSDRLLDDLALIMNTSLGLLIITGCAHSGIINTFIQARKVTGIKEICGQVGGMHLSHKSHSYLQQTFSELKLMKPKFLCSGHCTGFTALSRLHQTFPNEFRLNVVGKTIEITEKGDFKV